MIKQEKNMMGGNDENAFEIRNNIEVIHVQRRIEHINKYWQFDLCI